MVQQIKDFLFKHEYLNHVQSGLQMHFNVTKKGEVEF